MGHQIDIIWGISNLDKRLARSIDLNENTIIFSGYSLLNHVTIMGRFIA